MRQRPALLVLVALATGVSLLTVSPTEAQLARNENRPGEVVIETFGDTDATDPEIVAGVDEIRDEQAEDRDRLGDERLPDRRAAATGGITVSYLSPTPSDVRAVVDAAVADWNAALATSPNGPVVITFDWRDLNNLGGVLGYAGPTQYIQRGSSFVPVALANTLDNTDHHNGPEVEVTINSGLYGNFWYVDANNANVPGNRLDLYATVLHEIGHGVGFLGSAQETFSGPRLASPPDKFDTLVSVDGTPLLSFPNPESYLTSDNLDISIGGGYVHKLFAPSQFFAGSSYSHFDEFAYPGGQPGSLMTPGLSNGEVERVLDGPVLGVLAQSGWPMDVGAVSPVISSVNAGCNEMTVQWSVNLSDHGTPPTNHVVEALQSGTVRSSVNVVGPVNSATLTGLVGNQTYQLRVTPYSSGRAGAAATTTRTLTVVPREPRLVNVTGSGLSRTLSWQAPASCGSAITGYSIDVSKDGGAFAPFATTTNTSIATGQLANAVYQFRVKASNGNGSGAHGYSLPTGFTATVVRPFPLDGEIARLYEAYFGRLPDPSGMDYYLGLRANSVPLTAISDTFAVSTEFVQTYGPLGNAQFVDLIYQNVLGRPGDPGGVAYWRAQLDAGVSRGTVMLNFSQSPEFIARTTTAAAQTANEGSIYRLYLSYFLRPPDADGAGYWTRQVANGVPLTAVSAAFATSPEFTGRYGSLSNAEFVELVYANVLTRLPDSGGYDYWLGRLNAGLGRGDVMLAFSESIEFILRTGSAT